MTFILKSESVQKANSMETVLNTDACANTINEVNFIEQVEVIVTIKAPIRGQLEVYLTSPMGTRSQILPVRNRLMIYVLFSSRKFYLFEKYLKNKRNDREMRVQTVSNGGRSCLFTFGAKYLEVIGD